MRRLNQQAQINMFPFLSVLCAVIGVMILIIVLLLSTRIAAEEKRFRETERAETAGRLHESLLEGIDDQSLDRLNQELDQLELIIVDRQVMRDELMKQLAALEEMLEFRRTELMIPNQPLLQRELNRRERKEMRPLGPREGQPFPVYIEVSSTGYVVHPEGSRHPVISSNDTLTSFDIDPEFRRLFSQMNRRGANRYPVLLIHPNGSDAFWELRFFLDKTFPNLAKGWEPFSHDWILSNQESQP